MSGRSLEDNQGLALPLQLGWVGKQVTAGKEVWEAQACPRGLGAGRARSQRGEATVPFRPFCSGESPWRRRGRTRAK